MDPESTFTAPLPEAGDTITAATSHANGTSSSGAGATMTSAGHPGKGEAGVARLFEMTSDLLATISLDGRFTLLNPAWEQVLGWTREELLSRPMQELMHP